jgi:hypothetical protein
LKNFENVADQRKTPPPCKKEVSFSKPPFEKGSFGFFNGLEIEGLEIFIIQSLSLPPRRLCQKVCKRPFADRHSGSPIKLRTGLIRNPGLFSLFPQLDAGSGPA